MIIGKKEFNTTNGKSYVMGILNVTPDSFSDGGKYETQENAIKQVERMLQEGVDIIDIGGESTRPGYEKISEEEEIKRIIPIITEVKKRFDVPISVDTYKWKVAEAAIEAGADLINDIWGLRYYEDPEHQMARVVARAKVPVCIMHNRTDVAECNDAKAYWDILEQDLKESLSIAKEAGIAKNQIMLDPGVGFAKTFEQNMWCIPGCKRLVEMGYPVLLGISNKSVIGNITELPVDQRTEGTVALNVLG
ncbi:MAG: dihydropteroate synthase, partial [Eubacterium sp.]|nr:dihydropteroate synthase [Eubacterium sp.]